MAGTKPSGLWKSMQLEQMDGRYDSISAWLQDSGCLSLTSSGVFSPLPRVEVESAGITNSEALESSPPYKFDSVSCRLLDYVGIARANSGDSSLVHRTDGGGHTTVNSGLPPAEVEPAATSSGIISPLPRVEVESAGIINSDALESSPPYKFNSVSCRLLDYVGIARANSGDSYLVHRTDGGGPTTVNSGLPPAEVEPATTTSSLSTTTTSSPSKQGRYTWNLAAYRDYLARMRPLTAEEKRSVEMLLMEEDAGGDIQIVDEPPDSESDDDDTVHPPFTDIDDLWK